MGLNEQAIEAERGEMLTDEQGRALRDIAEGERGTFVLAGSPGMTVESPIAADLDVPVHVAWSRVMAEVEWIGKGYSQGLKYQFRGIDAVLNAVGPALRKHGVVVIPIKVVPEHTVVTSKSGAVMNYCRAVVNYAIIGPRGDVLMAPNELGDMVPIGQSLGEAFDTGDKASTKAQSVALREFYIKALNIPVNEPARDPEHGTQHEMGGPRVPSPEEYAAEIQNDKTSLNRLRQIKEELRADAGRGLTEVELLSGERVTLRALVQQVGMQRSQGGAR